MFVRTNSPSLQAQKVLHSKVPSLSLNRNLGSDALALVSCTKNDLEVSSSMRNPTSNRLKMGDTGAGLPNKAFWKILIGPKRPPQYIMALSTGHLRTILPFGSEISLSALHTLNSC